jgi:hypothetical protein
VAGGLLTNSPYYSPDDPRYRYPAPSTQQHPGAQQPPIYQQPGAYVAPRSDGAGINLSNQTLLFIGIGVLAFMLGTRRK